MAFGKIVEPPEGLINVMSLVHLWNLGRRKTRIRLHCTRIETKSVFGAEIGEKQTRAQIWGATILLGFGRKGMNEKKENVRERTSDERKLNWSLGSDECSCAAFVGCFRYYSQVAFSCSVFFFVFNLFLFFLGCSTNYYYFLITVVRLLSCF